MAVLADDERVVISFEPQIHVYESGARVAARVPGLSVTAYGSTPAEAVSGLDLGLTKVVRWHRERGTLESFLNRSRVDWCWFRDYRGDYRDVAAGGVLDEASVYPNGVVPTPAGVLV